MMLTDSWLNLLLVFAIPAIIVKVLNWPGVWIFSFSFIVIFPLAWLIGDLTVVVAGHLGEFFGSIIIATFGNAVELILVIVAIKEDDVRLVQAILMGSIFYSTLFILGQAMMVAGYKNVTKEIRFNAAGASVPVCSLLITEFLIMLISIQEHLPSMEGKKATGNEVSEVLFTSRVGAVLLIVMYIFYFIFSLGPRRDWTGEPEEAYQEQMSLCCGLICLFLVIAAIYIFSDWLILEINGVCEISGMSKTFLAAIIIPIRGNVVELWTAVSCAWKGNMNLSILITLGAAAQISLFVLPMAVIVGSILDKDVTIGYPLYEVTLLIFTMIIVAFLVQQGKANWLFGSMLIFIYCFNALSLWYEKEDS